MRTPTTVKEWRRGVDPQGHRGIPYLLKTTRLSVPSGRHWERQELTDFYRDGSAHLWTLRILECHSDLQEPHGGEPCASWHPLSRYAHEERPDRYPNDLWARLGSEDGPREGRGEVTFTIRLENRQGRYLEVARTVLECNMRRDLESMVREFPEDIDL
ncbi:hypothetical protein [Streptomyces sp. NPDC051162]|uniref:hypothetical protein n=1 Tax=Streptomyces sp. NPDC051162 TaxID=3154747 RepID=UPI00342DEC1A